MNQQYEILSATNIYISGIIRVEEQVWIQTYPNDKFRVTATDIKARFSDCFRNKLAVVIMEKIT